MPVSSNSDTLSSENAQLPPDVSAELEKLLQYVEKQKAEPLTPDSFEAIETNLRDRLMEIGRAFLKNIIEQSDNPDLRQVERDGETWYRVDPTKKNIMTTLGPVDYERARYRTGKGGASWVPVDDSLGLVDGFLTRRAAYLSLMTVAQITPGEAETLFESFGAMTPSASTLQRLPQVMQERYMDLDEEDMTQLREEEELPDNTASVSVSLDGVMVPIKQKGAGKTVWKEASCGTVSCHDDEGNRLKTLYFGQMPESGKRSLKASLSAEVDSIRKRRPDIPVIAIADGAKDNWRFLDGLSPDDSIIDFWHASEYLKTISDYSRNMKWFEKYRHILRHDPDGVGRVIRATRYLISNTKTDCPDLKQALGYFTTNRHRMNYAEAKAKGLPIGSGVVEAANKTLVTQRMKRSGMRWGIKTGQAILNFRSLWRSERLERVWNMMVKKPPEESNDNQPDPLLMAA